MKPTTKEPKKTISGELALLVAVMINSFGVVLMLYSKAGISAISSVPYAFSLAWPKLSLGTWTYLFQATLIISLMIMRKKFVLNYLFSFAVGFVFSEFLDLHELWIGILPTGLAWQVLYFVISYLLLCIGIAISNRCGLPIVICLVITACLTAVFLGHLEGLGIGTILAAFTMGKGVGIAGDLLDKKVSFHPVLPGMLSGLIVKKIV